MQLNYSSRLGAVALAACFPSIVTATFRLPPGFYLPQESSVPSLARSAGPVLPQVRAPASSNCRYLPGDDEYPTVDKWNELNQTVGGSLIQGTPLGHTCYGDRTDAQACSYLQSEWDFVDPYLDSPVNSMPPYWLNNSCSPFQASSRSCTLGNLAQYAINVSSAADVQAGMQFARENNIRLTIKNTGHDLLGRSLGEGSLALWTHNLKSASFINYTSSEYRGTAAKLGAGIQVHEAYKFASAHGLRVTGGGCPSVGLAGWLPGSGHGPLTSQYGLGADIVLEFEVVTVDGRHFTTSPTQEPDLYWALAGGGAGNYAIVLSMTIKAFEDGPVAGSTFMFTNKNDDQYWAGIRAWLNHLLVLDEYYPKLKTAVTFTGSFFFLDFATLADSTAAQLQTALAPFYRDLDKLGITLSSNVTAQQKNFVEHYEFFSGTAPWGVNQTVGNRLIPRSLVRDQPELFVNTIRNITTEHDSAIFVFVGTNTTNKNVGNKPDANSVNPAWRDALMLLNFGMQTTPDAQWPEITSKQVTVNQWQDTFRDITPGGGSYLNEGTWDNSEWKSDYFGSNYDRLESIKAKYDPEALLYANTAVGNDLVWTIAADGRMCRK